MYDRYADMEKVITDPDKLQIVNGSEVYISSEKDYDIAVDLQGRVEDFEQLKPFIILVAKSICELDNTIQKFEYQHNWIALSPSILLSEPPFYYDIETVFINDPYIILKYWGTEEDRDFDVVFEFKNGKFVLRNFDTVRDIPEDWEDMTPN